MNDAQGQGSSSNISMLFRDRVKKQKKQVLGVDRGGTWLVFFIINHIEQFASLHAHGNLVKIKTKLKSKIQ